MKRIPIVGFSKKFKRIKLPEQKAPSRFTSGSERELAAKSARKVLGEAPEYMGMSQRAISDMAAESLALRTAEKNSLEHYLKNYVDLDLLQLEVLKL